MAPEIKTSGQKLWGSIFQFTIKEFVQIRMDKLIDVVSPPITGSIQAEAEQLLNKEAGEKIPISGILLVLTTDVLSKTVGI